MNWFGILIFALLTLEGCFSLKNLPRDCPQIKIRFGRIRYKQRGKIARFLCNSGYMLAGDRFSVCVGGKWDTTLPRCVRATCPKAKPPANGLIYESHGGAVLNFYCRNGFQIRGPNITYCDGIRWENALPTCLPSNSKPSESCDFESEDLCGWNHDLNHDFDWKRLNFATPSNSIGTGPSYDHTKGVGKDGFYMYIESSARNINDTARLISPVYDQTHENLCFEFYYHMYGEATGSLRIYLKTVDKLLPQMALWKKDGNQGNKWFRGAVALGTIDEDFQIVIEGVRGHSYVSDIAIDDVRLIHNCTSDDLIDDTYTTSEESSTETPISVESCENRCNTNDSHTTDWLITCDCDDTCFMRNRCCPDYFDHCVFGTYPDSFEETTEPEVWSTVVEDVETTTLLPRTTRTPTTLKKEESKIVYVKPTDETRDSDQVPVRVTTIDGEVERTTKIVPVKEIELVDDYEESDKGFDHQKIVVGSKVEESNTKTIVFAVGVVFGVLFGAVGMTFVARRYQLCRCPRLNQSSNGDSQSDVRFLTSDEVLDFSLTSDYDTL